MLQYLQPSVTFVLLVFCSSLHLVKPEQPVFMGHPQPCRLRFVSYTPSDVETEWLRNVSEWQYDYCNKSILYLADAKQWLKDIQSAMATNAYHDFSSRRFFSWFTYHGVCDGVELKKESWIEPLFGALRHPFSLCGGFPNHNEYILSRDYLLVQSSESPPFLPQRRKLLFDLGASLYSSGSGGASQKWLIETYAKRGIEFDRILLWEAAQHNATSVFKDVPKALHHAYQYFNLPATSDHEDPSNPLNIIKKIGHSSDFIVLKLDIDANQHEMALMNQILQQRRLQQLIDEIFFEDHVNFMPLLPSWMSSADRSRFLSDTYSLFYNLRSKGVRVHGWP